MLCAIHKNGSRREAVNYRPIALLSHAQKVVKTALDSLLRSIYHFHPLQCGFRRSCSVETDLVRLKRAYIQGHRALAVLDLKNAFPAVPRGILAQTFARVLTPSLHAMISRFLQPEEIETIWDDTHLNLCIDRGVPQDLPLSPSLFNVFIDTLACQLSEAPFTTSEIPANIFCDDVLLMARDSSDLQQMLNFCTD